MKKSIFIIGISLLTSAQSSYIDYRAEDRPLWMIYIPKTVYPRHKQKPYTKKIHLANLHTSY